MQDMKLVDIPGTTWGNTGNINEPERNSKNKNMRDLYTGISEFKKVYQPKTMLLEDEKVTFLQIPTTL
jgi:hypothetical protein